MNIAIHIYIPNRVNPIIFLSMDPYVIIEISSLCLFLSIKLQKRSKPSRPQSRICRIMTFACFSYAFQFLMDGFFYD